MSDEMEGLTSELDSLFAELRPRAEFATELWAHIEGEAPEPEQVQEPAWAARTWVAPFLAAAACLLVVGGLGLVVTTSRGGVGVQTSGHNAAAPAAPRLPQALEGPPAARGGAAQVQGNAAQPKNAADMAGCEDQAAPSAGGSADRFVAPAPPPPPCPPPPPSLP